MEERELGLRGTQEPLRSLPFVFSPSFSLPPCPTFHSEAQLVAGRTRLRRKGTPSLPTSVRWAVGFLLPWHLQADPA